MRRFFVLVLLASALPAAPVAAGSNAPSFEGWGVRAGLADDPDQLLGGVQFDLGRFTDRLRFRPDVQLGVGDDHIMLSAGAPVHYEFDVDAPVQPYAGGGLVLGLVDRDAPRGSSKDDTDFEIAVEVVGGVSWRLRGGRVFSLELDLVFGDLHDIEVLAGWTF